MFSLEIELLPRAINCTPFSYSLSKVCTSLLTENNRKGLIDEQITGGLEAYCTTWLVECLEIKINFLRAINNALMMFCCTHNQPNN